MITKRKQGRRSLKGRQATPQDHKTVADLIGADLAQDTPDRTRLIEHLHTLNDTFGHLQAGHLAALAERLGISQVEAYETASFYAHFTTLKESDTPPPSTILRICEGPACTMAGAKALLKDALVHFGAAVRVLPAPCQGGCDTPPCAILNRVRLAPADMRGLETLHKAPPPTPSLTSPSTALNRSFPDQPENLVSQLEKAGLRGMGGAGFPVARKWAFFDGATHPRVLVVNADEGEPGTFKDRYLLETAMDKVLTGTVLAARALDVRDVFIYLRDEYPHILTHLQNALDHIHLPGVTIHLRRGAGAYVCGEETALINSLEGKRGQPRNRPPYPAQAGYLGRPTITHNVETLFWIADIAERGPEAYVQDGRPRYYSVSGRVTNPGVYCAPSNSTVQDLIAMAGGICVGHAFTAFLPGGASGGIFPAQFADMPMDFGVFEKCGGFVGSGALTVLSDQDNLWDVARDLMDFFAHESCGKCTPCRVGTDQMRKLIQEPEKNADAIRALSTTMQDASICGLGQAAPNPVLSLLNHFEGDAS